MEDPGRYPEHQHLDESVTFCYECRKRSTFVSVYNTRKVLRSYIMERTTLSSPSAPEAPATPYMQRKYRVYASLMDAPVRN